MTLKKLKEGLKKKTNKAPEKYYPVKVLEEKGFTRRRCSNCENHFWATGNRENCGEPECSGGYSFIENPVGKRMGYIETWEDFSKYMSKRGYEPIKRYPVVSRWRKDSYWTNASIYDFQPYVVSGEVEPPANPLVVPQMCVRFNSIDSVGISGRHNTSFVMIGQHAFKKPSEFDQDKYFEDYLTWFTDSVKIPKGELAIHEDQWGGGGNLGVSMEIFSRGLELGNQVYMNYEVTGNKYKELKTKVLDMGMGQDRPAWLTQGKHTIYQVTYPEVCDYLFKQTGTKESELYRKYLPYSGILNVDEIQDMEKGWKRIAKNIGSSKEELKKEVMPIAALYSIADHMHTLLFAITDGAIPSNTSGGHNLRTIYRRAHDFIDHYGWSIDLDKVMEKHADYLKPEFPEVTQHLEEVHQVLEHEKKKYRKTIKKSRSHIEKLMDKDKVTVEDVVEIYDTQGVSPELLRREAEKRGKEIEIPPDLYAKITLKHSKPTEEKEDEPEADVSKYPKTKEMFHEDKYQFKSKVLGNIKINGENYVVLEETAFYPEAGGQEPDHGTLNGEKVDDVQKIKGVILHRTKKIPKGKRIEGKIDRERRTDLTRHHTATHIINGAARRVLGDHVWQEGAKKYSERARLDLTHFELPSKEELMEIEEKANQAVRENIPVVKETMTKKEAEKKHGFRIYQGGHVPGNNIRIIKIDEWDTEACGGTHCNRTGEVGPIKIIGASKKQDGVIRVEYVAGDAVRKLLNEKMKKLEETARIIRSSEEKLISKAQKMQQEWKEQRKQIESLRKKIARGTTQKNEPIMYMEKATMELMNKVADEKIKEEPTSHIVIITEGSVVGKKGPKSKANIEKPVKKAAQMMGGSAGGTKHDVKGGGPKKKEAKKAYEELKKMMNE